MSTIPDPATTDWVPLQGRPSGMAYFGQWQTGHTYQDGDCVIGSDGVLYACVTDGTTTAPVAWPGAAGPAGVAGPQGPQGVGIPMPVVNGSWVKGVSGAAVWTALTQDQLVPNLGALGATAPGKDLNNALDDGWYTISADADQWGPTLNRPTSYGMVHVSSSYGTSTRQTVYEHGSLNTWQRQRSGGQWYSWVQTTWSPAEVTWSGPAYQPGFGDYSAPYGPIRFKKVTSGLVVCEGLMSVPGQGFAFQFPAGYRPGGGTTGRSLIFFCASSMAGSTETWRIDNAGNVSYTGPNAAGWVSMSGVNFFPL